MLAAFVVHMTHEAMRGRKCIPAWRALPPRERLIFFGFVVASEDTAELGCMRCVSEGACPCAESECHYPTWERRVERVGPSDAVEAEATGAGWRREG
jgi:hypothetical protein